MSYRTKAEISASKQGETIHSSRDYAYFAVLPAIALPSLGRMVAEFGWFAQRELLIWGSVAVGAICIACAIAFGVHAHRTARRDIQKITNG